MRSGSVRWTSAPWTLLASVIAFLLVFQPAISVLVDAGAQEQDSKATSRGTIVPECSESDPPPYDSNSDTYVGNWVISCKVTISFHRMKLNGDLRITSTGTLKLTLGSELIQIYDHSTVRPFRIEANGVLQLDTNSALNVDQFTATSATISFTNSTVRTSGTFVVEGGQLTASSTTFYNLARAGSAGEDGRDATFKAVPTVSTDAMSIQNSIIHSKGGSGSPGGAYTPAGIGGDSNCYFFPASKTIQGNFFNISGGNGGNGMGGMTGDAGRAAAGGSAYFVTIANEFKSTDETHKTSISVKGGSGGDGGQGADTIGTADKEGGSGSSGELGGGATVNITADGDFKIKASSSIVAIGGNGGLAGKGGKTDNPKKAGNGGNGGSGGRGAIIIPIAGGFTATQGVILAQGGNGTNGGVAGLNNAGGPQGISGKGGSGGAGVLVLNVTKDFISENSTVLAIGGKGGNGGWGMTLVGEGGNGGDASTTITADMTITSNGKADALAVIGSAGGKGGNSGIDGSGTYKARGGTGGVSYTFLGTTGTSGGTQAITMQYSWLRAFSTEGGQGGSGTPGSDGVATIFVNTTQTIMRDCIADWTLEGFAGEDFGKFYNVTNYGIDPVYIRPKETNAVVEIYWSLYVWLDGVPATTQVKVEVYEGPIVNGIQAVAPVSIMGNQKASFENVLGQVIKCEACEGSVSKNFTVIGRTTSLGDTMTKNILMKKNWEIHLQMDLNTYAPIIEVSPTALTAYYVIPVETLGWGIKSLNGLAYENPLDPINAGTVEDVQITFTHKETGKFLDINSQSVMRDVYAGPGNNYDQDIPADVKKTLKGIDEPVLTIEGLHTIRSDWKMEWILNTPCLKYNKRTWCWEAGDYEVDFKVYDGKFWNTDPGAKGWTVVKYNVTIKQPDPPLPKIFLCSMEETSVDLKWWEETFTVSFNDACIAAVCGTDPVRITRMEWDFENDGTIDWALFPNCEIKPTDNPKGGTNTCFKAPPIEWTYSVKKAGSSILAKFYVTTDTGQTVSMRKDIRMSQEPHPITNTFYQDIFPIVAVFLIVIMGFGISVNAMRKYRKTEMVRMLMEESRVDAKLRNCERCGEALQEGSTDAQCEKCAATDYLSSIQQVITEIKSTGVDVVKAEGILEEAVGLFDKGKYDEAKQKAYEAQELANSYRQRYVQTSEVIGQWENEIKSAKDALGTVDMGKTSADETLYQARLSLGRGQYEHVAELLGQISSQIDEVKIKGRYKAILERIQSIERMMVNVKKRNIKVFEAEELVKRATKAYNDGQYLDAESMASDAEKSVKKTNMQFVDASEALANAIERAEQGASKAMDMTKPLEAITKMRNLLREGLYSEVINLKKEIEPLLPAIRAKRKLAWEREAMRIAKAAAPPVATAGTLSSEVIALQSMLAESAEGQAASETKASETLTECYELLTFALEKNVVVDDAQDLYNDSRNEMEQGHFDVAIDYAQNAMFLMRELLMAMGYIPPEKKKVEAPAPAAKIEEEARPVVVPPQFEAPGAAPRPVMRPVPKTAAEPTMEIAPPVPAPVPAYVPEPVTTGPPMIAPLPPITEPAPVPAPQAPVPEPEPAPAPSPVPVHAPVPMPTPAPEPVPEPAAFEPAPMPAPPAQVPAPEPLPAPAPFPVPGPEPVSELAPPPVIVPVPVPTPEQAAPPPEEVRRCSVCGTKVKPKWKTCPACGTPLEGGFLTPVPPPEPAPPQAAPEPAPAPAAEPTPVPVPVAASEKRDCPGCGKQVRTKWKTCPFCGIDLEATTTEAQASAPAAEPAPEAKPKCPSCGKDVKAKWKTCPYCGADTSRSAAASAPAAEPAPEAKPKCPNCGKDIKAKWKTCPYCGHIMG